MREWYTSLSNAREVSKTMIRPAVSVLAMIGIFWVSPASCQTPDTGRAVFETRCAVCHGGDGKGGEFAPGILAAVAARGDPELTALIRSGVPNKGMPGFSFVVTEMAPLLSHLRLLASSK